MVEHVILVDENDRPVGEMEKMEAHRQGLLHRAFSVFIFDTEGKLLLQKRANSKYHSGGLWTNTCCSHPRPGEDIQKAAERRLKEEMGLSCEITPAFSFIYKASFHNGLTEHELDHVFIGKTNLSPKLNLEEAEDWKYMKFEDIMADVLKHPGLYTEWFKISLKQLAAHISKEQNPD